MSIEKLEDLKNWAEPRTHQYYDTCRTYDTGGESMFKILDVIIPILKHQSDQIADLRQQLAKKEDVITLSEIKEVTRLNG